MSPTSSLLMYSNELDYDSERDMELRRVNYMANVTVRVGDSVVLYCAVNASHNHNPGVIWMQGKLGHVLTLNTNRITVDTRFQVVQQPTAYIELPEGSVVVRNRYAEQQRPTQHYYKRHNSNHAQSTNEYVYYHLKIDNVQTFDENEYACETTATELSSSSNIQSLINLHVTQSPSFIESQTSESNLIALENGNAILKCFAVGKPMPIIKWYKINDDLIQDLQHESTTITIRNISKTDTSKYECVAGNHIEPSVSKKFTITVYYAPIVQPVRPVVFQLIGQTVLLGCQVQSNPDSTVVWYKAHDHRRSIMKPTEKMHPRDIYAATTSADYYTYEQEYAPIDIIKSKYHILKYKQANQTVSYFKIKNVEASDFGKYKCEVTNSVGKSESMIQLLEKMERDETIRLQPAVYGKEDTSESSSDHHHTHNHQNRNDNEFNSDDTNEFGMNRMASKMRKKQAKHDNNTLLKYQINKLDQTDSDSENSLQQIDEFYSSAHSDQQASRIIQLLSFNIITLTCFLLV